MRDAISSSQRRETANRARLNRSPRRFRLPQLVQEAPKRTRAARPCALRDLAVEAAIERELADRNAVVVARADALWGQQRRRHLIEVAFLRGSVQRRITIVV